MHTESQPSNAEMVAALLMGQGNSQGVASLVPLSTRIPSWQLSQLTAMAFKAGKTRNSMVALVLDVGIEAIRSGLDDKTRDELAQLEGEASLELPAMQSGETF